MNLQLVGLQVGKPIERLKWKRVRHHAANAVWPPAGVSLRMDYALPQPDSDSQPPKILVRVHY